MLKFFIQHSENLDTFQNTKYIKNISITVAKTCKKAIHSRSLDFF